MLGNNCSLSQSCIGLGNEDILRENHLKSYTMTLTRKIIGNCMFFLLSCECYAEMNNCIYLDHTTKTGLKILDCIEATNFTYMTGHCWVIKAPETQKLMIGLHKTM